MYLGNTGRRRGSTDWGSSDRGSGDRRSGDWGSGDRGCSPIKPKESDD